MRMASTKTKPKTTDKYDFTADDIGGLRDGELLSWRHVAERLQLGSPGAARRAYSTLVRPHTESVLPGRVSGNLQPVHLADADLDTVRDTIVGYTIVVQRGKRIEDVSVDRVTSVKNGTVNFHDGAKARSVKANAIIAIK